MPSKETLIAQVLYSFNYPIMQLAIACDAIVKKAEGNEEMKVAAAYAIASLVRDEELSVDYIIPSALNKEVGAVVAEAVAQAARESGVARI